MPVKHTYYYQQPNGNTYKKIIANGFEEPLEITKYSYNANNMLTKAVVEDKQNGKTTEVLYYYDALNRRNAKISKELVNGAEISSKTTEYFWYGDKIWYEKVTDADGSEKLANLWGSRGLAARNDMTYSQDGHGSVDAEYSGTELSNEYRYDAYGNEIDESTSGNPYRYCSEYYDEETGLYYLRNRYYDPALGRFITEDPAQDGLNWYVYCENEPINRIDPSGYFDVYDFYNVGFVYDPNQDIWYSPQNCWQRWWGYNDFYDQAAEGVINIDTRKVIFNFEGRDWRVQFWKGDYGPTTGGEIGVYYKDENDWVEHYNAVSDSDMLHMSLELYKGNETIFKRVYGEYWWANGFKVDGGTDPSELRLHSLITFHVFDTDEERNYRMRQAFIKAYVQQYGYDGIQFSTNPTDNTISIDW